jgi:hypothetical protein
VRDTQDVFKFIQNLTELVPSTSRGTLWESGWKILLAPK